MALRVRMPEDGIVCCQLPIRGDDKLLARLDWNLSRDIIKIHGRVERFRDHVQVRQIRIGDS